MQVMKYKRLFRVAPKRAEKFLTKYAKTFERDFKNRNKEDQALQTMYFKIKVAHQNKRYGHEFLKWIDNFQLSLGLLLMFVYEDQIENLIPKASLLTSLIKWRAVNDFKEISYE